MLYIYLAGAIRDDRPEDYVWRGEVIDRLSTHIALGQLGILSPLGGKTYNPKTKLWKVSGIDATPGFIVGQDIWCVDKADLIVFNLMALGEGYPNIGTMVEFGRSTAKPTMRYVIVPKGYSGHSNAAMFKLHPFIQQHTTAVFYDVPACIDFLARHVSVLAGGSPHFRGEA